MVVNGFTWNTQAYFTAGKEQVATSCLHICI